MTEIFLRSGPNVMNRFWHKGEYPKTTHRSLLHPKRFKTYKSDTTRHGLLFVCLGFAFNYLCAKHKYRMRLGIVKD